MVDTFIDENGWLNFNRSQNGSGMSKRAQASQKFVYSTCPQFSWHNHSFYAYEPQRMKVSPFLKTRKLFLIRGCAKTYSRDFT